MAVRYAEIGKLLSVLCVQCSIHHPTGNGEGGRCSLFPWFSVSTVGLDSRARMKTTTNPPFPFRSGFIYEMQILPNKTRQTVFRYDPWWGTSTNTTNHSMSFTILKMKVKGCFWRPIASHCEAGRGDLKLAKYWRQDQYNFFFVLTTLFHPRQTRKGAQCYKYRNCPLSHH